MTFLGTGGEKTCRREEDTVNSAKGTQGHKYWNHKGQWAKHSIPKGHSHSQGAKHLSLGNDGKISKIHKDIDASNQWHSNPNSTWQISKVNGYIVKEIRKIPVCFYVRYLLVRILQFFRYKIQVIPSAESEQSRIEGKANVG